MAADNGVGGTGGVIGGGVIWSPGPFEAWAQRYVDTQWWRVRRLFISREDALQECAIVFVRCCRLYAGSRAHNPPLFMALYKTAVVRSFHDFAARDTRLRRAEAAAIEQARLRVAIDYSEGPLYTLLSRASRELIEVLRVIATAPSELLFLLLDSVSRRSAGGVSRHARSEEAALSRALCRLARCANVRSDLLAELRGLLRE